MDHQTSKYRDMINLPHHVSKKRPQMPLKDRAAQFSPFAAVVGHQDAIKETERLTQIQPDLDDMEKALIDQELRLLESRLSEGVEVKITYFEPDLLKSGGAYVSLGGRVIKLDPYEKVLVFESGARVLIERLIHLTCVN